jgi:hypothetical protein
MTANGSMRWIVKGLPTAVFLLTAAFFVCAGFVFPLSPVLVRFGNGGGPGIGVVVFGAALIVGGLALVWLARGLWRAWPWATHVALVFSVAVIAYLASLAPGAFTSNSSVLNPSTGQLEPQYDTGAKLIVLAIIPFTIVVACLIVKELQQRRVVQQN